MQEPEVEEHVHDGDCCQPETIQSLAPLPPYYRENHETGEITPITRSEYKKAMLAEFTKKYPVNPQCGHKVRVGFEPNHRNCDMCWFAYFQIHGEVTKLADEIMQEHGHELGGRTIKQIKGTKFRDNYLKFMSTLAQFKELSEAAQEQDEQRTSGTEVVSSAGSDTGLQAGGTEEGS
jgi:hypothetical protein